MIAFARGSGGAITVPNNRDSDGSILSRTSVSMKVNRFVAIWKLSLMKKCHEKHAEV